MKKIFTLGVMAFAVLLSSCGTTKVAEAPVEEKAPCVFTPTEEGDMDLSTANSADYRCVKFNEETGVLSVKGAEYFQVPLGEYVEAGTVIKVHLVGKNNGTVGFRCWLTDDNQVTLADPLYLDCIGEGLPAGDFDLSFELKASGTVANFFLKGPQYGTMIDDIEITKLVLNW